jgi:hypothetical protein
MSPFPIGDTLEFVCKPPSLLPHNHPPAGNSPDTEQQKPSEWNVKNHDKQHVEPKENSCRWPQQIGWNGTQARLLSQTLIHRSKLPIRIAFRHIYPPALPPPPAAPPKNSELKPSTTTTAAITMKAFCISGCHCSPRWAW